jgi:hypothetical protein
MKKHWLRGMLLGVSMALLLAGGVALAEKEPPAGPLATADVHDVNLVTLEIDDDGGCTAEYAMWWPTTGFDDWMSYGHLLIGNADSLEDGVCWGGGWDGDWATTPGGDITITEPGVVSDEDGYAQYGDLNDPTPLGLEVTQYSCAWEDPPNDDFVIVAYVIENVSDGPLSGLFAGHYVDPDVDGTVGDDTTEYLPGLQMGAQWDESYMGLTYLSGGVRTYNNMDCCIDEDAEGWPAISNGQFDPPYTGDDIMFTMGSGPFSLAPGEAYLLGTAWVAGESASDLAANANQAHTMWFASEGCGIGLEVPVPEEPEFVPEPGSVMLLASGLMGLAGYAGLRLRKK